MKNSYKRNLIKYVYVIVGIIIGYWHLRIGMVAIFLFSEHEQIFSWLLILSGPFLTLPSILIAIKNMKLSAFCLLFGSIVSFIMVIMAEGYSGEHIQQFLIKITMPMLMLAVSGYFVDKIIVKRMSEKNKEEKEGSS
jgi:hypothetical protein